MKTTLIPFGGLGNLPTDTTLAVVASTGHHLGCTKGRFELHNISDPHTMLGNDAFTEAYIVTDTGNLYRIARKDDGTSHGRWTMCSIRDKARGWSESSFLDEEIRRAVLEVGRPFFHGTGKTTTVVAILAVNASRCYLGAHKYQFTSDIRKEFNRLRDAGV